MDSHQQPYASQAQADTTLFPEQTRESLQALAVKLQPLIEGQPIDCLEMGEGPIQIWLYARQHPGKLSYGSAGAGNVTHLGALLLLRSLQVDAVHVPYRGSAPAMTDLVGGQVQLMTNTLNDSLGFIREGKLRALAVTSRERSAQLPDVPTVAETVAPGFEMGAWQGVVVPAGTPQPVVQKLNAEIRRALQSDEMQKQLKVQGAQALGSTPQEYGAYIQSEIQRWGAVIKEAGVKLD